MIRIRRRRHAEREQCIRDRTMCEFAARIRDGELGIQFAVGLRNTPYFAEFEAAYKEMEMREAKHTTAEQTEPDAQAPKALV